MDCYKNVVLDKNMYKIAGKSFSEILEEIDSSQSYAGEFSNLDAYQRQLKRFDIKVSDINADCIEKFFRTAQTATLFPEYVHRAVKAGAASVKILDDILAVKTQIDGVDYRTIYCDADAKQPEQTTEGAEIPSVNVRLKENLVKLTKAGQMLVASYESIRNQKIELFSIILKQVGAKLAQQQLKGAIETLLAGDGTIEPEIKNIESALEFEQLIDLWSSFDEYKMNTILVSPEMMRKLLSLQEILDAKSGFKFEINGEIATLLGAKLIRSRFVPKDTIIALDKRYALEMVSQGDIIVEHDKLIDKQLERAAITSTFGFARICKPAVKILKYDLKE
ncbi:MAG: phage major capsid protein [Oscillospiraceae bacterium]|jgi:hypothetical protein|nr:phage major capsid protein [Oscillospiraceae bacterium]